MESKFVIHTASVEEIEYMIRKCNCGMYMRNVTKDKSNIRIKVEKQQFLK